MMSFVRRTPNQSAARPNPFGCAQPFLRSLRFLLLNLLCLCSGLLLLPSAVAAPIEAKLDRNQIGVGESVTLTISISGSVSSEPALPPIAGLNVQGTGTQSEIHFDGFHASRTTTFSFDLTPTSPGRYTIPPIQAGIDGQTVSTQPIVLTVLRNRPAAVAGSGPAFVQVYVPKTNMYFGEVVDAEIRCYVQNPSRMSQPVLNSDGFSASQISNPGTGPGQIPIVNVNNIRYALYVFKVAITPNKTGDLTLGPASWELNVQVGRSDFFGFGQQQHITVASDSIPVTVRPVPPPPNNAPFSGAVGQFSLSEFDAAPTTVNVGDPITLKIRIAGHGSFDNVTIATNLAGWNDFTTYPPTTKFDSTDPLQIEGSKYFEQVVTPQNASVKVIPAFAFTFFDPENESFHTLSHAPVPITVKPGAATPQPTVISTGAPPPDEQQTREIVHIMPFFGKAIPDRPPLILRPWFLAIQAAPPLIWIAALIWRRQKDSLANNPRLRRQRRVAQVVQDGLADLSRLAAAGDHEPFYAGVFRLLQEQLGERLDLPASAITEAALDDLPRLGLDAETQKQLHELFHACNQYRYAPEHAAQEMASVLPRLKTALGAFQRMKPRFGPGKSVAPTLGCLALLVLTQSLRAQPASDAFSQANKLYEEGKYDQAAAAYQALLNKGEGSVAVWFNLGNAQYKAGRVGQAIEAYRLAETCAPRDPDIRANLRFARDQVANYRAALPGGPWTRWVARVSLDEWAVAASVSLALFFLLLAARQIRPALKTSFGPVLVLGAVSVCLIACLCLAVDQRFVQKSAVVIVSEAVARRGPLDESQSAFTLHDGAELLVLDRQSPWVEVADAASHAGWLPEKDLAFIP